MKNSILTPLAVVFLSVIGCSKPDNGGKDNPQPPAPSQEQITIPSTVDVTPVVPSEGGDAKITFTAATAWTASVISTKADSWVDVNPKSGDPGPAEIKITTTPNDTYVERNATIQIKCGGQTKNIVLTQKQVDNITVTTDKVELGAEGGAFTIELKSNIDFSYEIKGDWIKYVSTKAYADKTLTFTAEPNDGVQKREGSVTIKGGEFSETVKVYQSGEEPTLIITQNEYNLEAEGGSIAVEVSSNVAVTMTIPENVSWITENKTKSVSTSTFHLDVAANETYETRSAEITFSNEESGISEKVTVNQKGGDKENFVHFEDSPELEAYLIGEFDLDGDGRLSEEEASKVTSINLANTDIGFTSLKGIEYFVNLQFLNVPGEYYMYDESVGYEQWQPRQHKLYGTVDLSKNIKLSYIFLRNNEINELILPPSKDLQGLNINNNRLTYLDVSRNLSLQDLDIGNNEIKSLDVSKNNRLFQLYAISNLLTEIDISHCPLLEYLSLGDNCLTSIDLTNNTKLRSLDLFSNDFFCIDVSMLGKLESLNCLDIPNLKYILLAEGQNIERLLYDSNPSILIGDVLTLTPESYELSASDDIIKVEALSTTGSQFSSASEWISLVDTKQDNNIITTYTFMVQANNTSENRNGLIVLCDGNGTSYTVTITQNKKKEYTEPDWKKSNFFHTSLMMRFTATWCTYCPQMAESVVKAKDMYPDKIEAISMHASGDLYFNDVRHFESMFGISSYPTGVVDCRRFIRNQPELETTTNLIVDAYKETEENYPTVTGISFNSTVIGDEIEVDVSVYAKVAEEFRITVLLLEDGISAAQEGADPGYIHYDVPRLTLSKSILGNDFTVPAPNTIVPLHFSGKIPSGCKVSNCRILVFIQRKYGSQAVLRDYGMGEWYIDNCVSGKATSSVPLVLVGENGAPQIGDNEDITPGDDIEF